MCTFCDSAIETYEHLFWECHIIERLWAELFKLCDFKGIEVYKTVNHILLLGIHDKPQHVVNYLVIIIKQYIYSLRCLNQTPSIAGMKNVIEKQYNVEYFIAKTEHVESKFHRKWKPICNN